MVEIKNVAEFPLTNRCIICHLSFPVSTLLAHHHCCDDGVCETIYFDIVRWERRKFSDSYLEKLSSRY